jgi:hypothetical protein
VVMGVVVWFLKEPTYYLWNMQNKNFILLIPVGGIVYIGMLLLTGGLTKEMIQMVMKKKLPVKQVTSEISGGEIKDSENLK